MCTHTHMYIYIYIEREREIHTYMYTHTQYCACMYICIYIYIYIFLFVTCHMNALVPVSVSPPADLVWDSILIPPASESLSIANPSTGET